MSDPKEKPKVYHAHLDVINFLVEAKKQDYRKAFVNPDTGKPVPHKLAKKSLCVELLKGHMLLPLDEDCEGFDFKTGCPGHEE